MKINYLTLILVSAILLGIMFFGEIYRAYTPVLVLTIITFVISAVNLFLIHHKELQLRLLIYNAIVLIAYQIWIVYLFWKLKSGNGIVLEKFPISVVFPVICAILCFIAAGMLRRMIIEEDFKKTVGKSSNRRFQK